MEWVLDSSFALSLVLPEEYSSRADAFLQQRSSEDTFDQRLTQAAPKAGLNTIPH